ncbi:MAG TPA: class I SAM-dependent methyltransferase [Gaiellaceae bacterium]|nr:class I SAM-dependent methyltransferase [Gaiellaceae bacterium]
MKMNGFEKRFVNGARHGEQVAARAERLVGEADPQPGERLLDVGCGTGAATLRLADSFGLDVVGVDVDPEQIEAARAAARGLPSARFIEGDAARLPFADGEFDLVFSSKTTHHVHDWQRALEEMIRVLKPGGRLCYSDFVAPAGRRLPTRGALDRIAEAGRLETVRAAGSPLTCTRVYRVPDEAAVP